MLGLCGSSLGESGVWCVVMSRLRRLVLSDRFFFVTCRLLPLRGTLLEAEFELLARVVRDGVAARCCCESAAFNIA